MSLELASRLCGRVHVVDCKGRIGLGQEVEALQSVLAADTYHDVNQVVLQVAEVTRLDSTGLGFLVRQAVLLRKRGGDLRLAVPPPFLTSLLNMTRVSSIMEAFPTEEEAILSFLRQQSEAEPAKTSQGNVLVVDPSGDLCAFVRVVLGQHGLVVQSVSLVRDARILLQVGSVEFILIGPGVPQPQPGSTAASLQALAPRSRVVQLGYEFKACDAHECAGILLNMLKP